MGGLPLPYAIVGGVLIACFVVGFLYFYTQQERRDPPSQEDQGNDD